MSAESLRQRLANAAPGPWLPVTYEILEAKETEAIVMMYPVLMPNYKPHVIHEVEQPDEVGFVDEYDRDCEGCEECGVDENGTTAEGALIAHGRQDLEALLAFVDAYDAFQTAGRIDDRGRALVQLNEARAAIETLP